MTYTLVASRVQAAADPAIRRMGFLLAFLAVPAFALLALALGKEGGWDLRNYHWYDPYALLGGRIGFDIAVAHHATYYNPLIDVPFYWLGAHFPGWVAGLYLGAQAGAGAALVGGIAYRMVPLEDKRLRLALAATLAVLGMLGGGALSEIGKTSDDISGALGVLAALLLLLARLGRVVIARRGDLLGLLVPAGILAGASPGLKLTTAPYAVGLAVALFTLPGSFWRRLARTTAFGTGALIGIAIFGGYWFWRMYAFSGDPLFPYFNNIFPTGLVVPGDYSDPTFLLNARAAPLTFPFVFSLNSLKVAEWSFRDFHIAIAYVLVPLAGLAAAFGMRPWTRRVETAAARLLLVTAAVTYLLWFFLFAVYRYLVPLEMLCPTIIVVALALLPISRRAWIALAVVILVAAQAAASRGDDPRLPWTGRYVEVDVPPLADPAHTMVLMTESQPTAYVIPEFPPEIPFLRIQGWLLGSQDRTYGLGREMHERVAAHQGPLFDVFWSGEREASERALRDYDLALDASGCTPLRSNLDAVANPPGTAVMCPLTRTKP